MTTATFSDEALASAQEYETLGPAYFEARRIVERQMEKFADKHFEPLIDQFAKEFQERLWMVDASVFAILTGERWAIERYALDKYDGPKVREAVAKHIPQELQDARIADLEKEVARLKKNLEFYQNR